MPAPRPPRREAVPCATVVKCLRVPAPLWALYVAAARAWGTTAEALAVAQLRAGARSAIALPPDVVAAALGGPSTGRRGARSRRGRRST